MIRTYNVDDFNYCFSHTHCSSIHRYCPHNPHVHRIWIWRGDTRQKLYNERIQFHRLRKKIVFQNTRLETCRSCSKITVKLSRYYYKINIFNAEAISSKFKGSESCLIHQVAYELRRALKSGFPSYWQYEVTRKYMREAGSRTTSFPGSLIAPGSGKMRDPGNELGHEQCMLRKNGECF